MPEIENQIIIQRGNALEELEQSEGFVLLMDYLRDEALQALRAVRDTESADPLVVQDLVRKWRERDLLIEQILFYIRAAKAARLSVQEQMDGRE